MYSKLKASELTVGQEVTVIHTGNGFGDKTRLSEGYTVTRLTKTRLDISRTSASGNETYTITYVVNKYGEVAQEVGKKGYNTDEFAPADSEYIARIKANNAKVEIKHEALLAARALGANRYIEISAAKDLIAKLEAFIASAE